MKKHFLFILTVMLFVLNAQAQDPSLYLKYAREITSQELKEHVKTLASEEFAGRGTGQDGLNLAAAYIRDQFIQTGLSGPSPTGDPYFQEFKLVKGGNKDIFLISGTDTLTSHDHFLTTGVVPEIHAPLPVVFIGYGIDDSAYSDYSSDDDLTGKVAIFIAGEPINKDGKYVLSTSYLPRFTDRGASKAEMAYSRGASLVIRMVPDQEQINKMLRLNNRFRNNKMLTLPDTGNSDDSDSPGLIHLGVEDAARILRINPADIDKALERMNKGKSPALDFSSQLMIIGDEKNQFVSTQNVACFIEGSDLKEEWIVVTAHYDHLGKRDSVIRYGADDNASGTATVIELAESFAEMAKDGIRPRRSILFLPVSAEEIGLIGSRYYVENPIYPLSQTKAAVNMDMIGRTDDNHIDQPEYVYIYVSDSTNSHIANLSAKAADMAQVPLQTEFRYKNKPGDRKGGSDHSSFENKGIPVLYFYCGLHKDYHRPTDTWEKVEYEKMAKIGQVVFMSILELANQ